MLYLLPLVKEKNPQISKNPSVQAPNPCQFDRPYTPLVKGGSRGVLQYAPT